LPEATRWAVRVSELEWAIVLSQRSGCPMTEPRIENPAIPSDLAATPENPTEVSALTTCVENLDLPRIDRHIFLCADQTKPKCCSTEAGLEAWDYLKRRLKELQLDRTTEDRPTCIFRTKANCLRVCMQGPILVVYPDGVWYRAATPPVIERIVREHLLGGRVVEEYAFLRHPLTGEIEPSESNIASPVENTEIPIVQSATPSQS